MNNIFNEINPPIITASGCWASTEEQILKLMTTNIGAICLKTCTLESRDGNPEPTYYTNGGFTFNSKGLPNPGYSYYRDILIKYNVNNNKPFFISIGYESNDNCLSILKDLQTITKKQIFVELNMSCPNVKNKTVPAYNIDILNNLLFNLKEFNNQNKIIIGIKLPPYLDTSFIHKVCDILNNHLSVKFITMCNSIPNTVYIKDNNYVLNTIMGGMSGKANKYVSLGSILHFKKKLDSSIVIIGCGGISDVSDIDDYFMCGATYVQIASCFYEEETNSLNLEKINNLIEKYKIKIANA